MTANVEAKVESEFNRDELKRKLAGMGGWASLAFGLSCSERLFPNYRAFQQHHKWGDEEALRAALDIGWRVLSGERVADKVISDTLARVRIRNTRCGRLRIRLCVSGLDAGCTASLVLQFVQSENVKHIAEIGELCHDTVDMHVAAIERKRAGAYALDREALDREQQEILKHPLMQRELARQRRDIERLVNTPPTAESAKALAAEWRNPAASNIDAGVL